MAKKKKPDLSIFDSIDEEGQVQLIPPNEITEAKEYTLLGVDYCDPFAKPACSVAPPKTSSIQVPNKFPTIPPTSYRIAIIGEAPGQDEEHELEPFVGQSGRFLNGILSKTNIVRESCYLGNVCQYRPPGNDISLFPLEGPQIQEGLEQLKEDLAQFNPNICVLLGKTALWAAKGTQKIGDWRGSYFIGASGTPFEGRKCIATYHPAAALRTYDFTPLIMFDFRKAMVEAEKPTLELPQRNLITNGDFDEIVCRLTNILINKPKTSFDIEGGVVDMSCISLATSPYESFIIPFSNMDGSNYWDTAEKESVIWGLLAQVLGDPSIPKILQNGLYDRFVLQYSHNIVVRGMVDDTMLKNWELYCELEKSLGFLCSIHTREPFYKSERKTDDQQTFWRYCCRDSAVTFEISEKLDNYLDDSQKRHYRQNIELLNVLLYMELRGIRYDSKLASDRLMTVQEQIYDYQDQLDNLAIELDALVPLTWSSDRQAILAQVQSICCYKKDPTTPKAPFADEYPNLIASLLDPDTDISSPQFRGRVAIFTKTTLNTKSTKKFQNFLYGTCGLPTQYKKDPKTKEMRPTTDYEALLKLSKTHNKPVLKIALELSRLRTRAQMLATVSHNGRMYCSYNLVGSETARVTSRKSVIYNYLGQVGANMQTIPDDWDLEDTDSPLTQGMRDLFLADEGCYLGKCDLKGADGWTIGAYLAMLGDRTMLDDLLAGLKPAQIVAYILKHGPESVKGKTRAELKEMVKEIKKDDWEYFVSKQGIWGTCYTMGARKLAEIVFIQSEGKVNLTEQEAKNFQAAIYIRYNVRLLHRWMENYMLKQSYPAKLTAPNGFVRKFFARNFGSKPEVLGEALAHLPQVITTHATNSAAHRLWLDPENRVNKVDGYGCKLLVEPMHQVHDEIVLQWAQSNTEWALAKIKTWFNNPINIAGQMITIPYDGSYGHNWAMDEGGKVGSI